MVHERFLKENDLDGFQGDQKVTPQATSLFKKNYHGACLFTNF